MPGSQTKQKSDPLDKPPLDAIKAWKYMCVRGDVHARLDRQRRRRAGKVGFKLSWTKFFVLLADDMEKLESQGR
jgi:hypothetical protein